MLITSIVIDGIECIGSVLQTATEIVVASNSIASTARLAAQGTPAIVGTAIVGGATVMIAPVSQDAITIYSGATVIFSGYISRVEPRLTSHNVVTYSLSCQDDVRDLDAIVVASATYTAQTDIAIIQNLIDVYGGSPPVVTTAGVVGSSPPVTLDSISFVGLTLRQCLERICDRTNSEWRLGFDGDLKYYAVGANTGAFDFSDVADGIVTEYYLQSDFGYQEEFSTPANSVTVTGYQAPKPNQVTSAVSVTASADDGRVGCSNLGVTFPPELTDTPTEATNETSCAMQCTWEPLTNEAYYALLLMRFDTSSIPDDAEILSAILTLTMYQAAAESADLEFGIDYYPASNWPITAATDYISTPYDGSGAGARTAFDWKFTSTLGLSLAATVPSQHTFTLLTPNASISKTGYTGLRMYIGSDTSMSGKTNTVWAFMHDHAKTGWRPKLTVAYQQPQPEPVTGSYTDAASVALYGTFEKALTDANCTTQGECEARAETECARYGYPRNAINCTFDRDGLDTGDTVHFNSANLGIDADYIVKRLRLKWPGVSSKTRYQAELGEFRPDLIQFLRKG